MSRSANGGDVTAASLLRFSAGVSLTAKCCHGVLAPVSLSLSHTHNLSISLAHKHCVSLSLSHTLPTYVE